MTRTRRQEARLLPSRSARPTARAPRPISPTSWNGSWTRASSSPATSRSTCWTSNCSPSSCACWSPRSTRRRRWASTGGSTTRRCPPAPRAVPLAPRGEQAAARRGRGPARGGELPPAEEEGTRRTRRPTPPYEEAAAAEAEKEARPAATRRPSRTSRAARPTRAARTERAEPGTRRTKRRTSHDRGHQLRVCRRAGRRRLAGATRCPVCPESRTDRCIWCARAPRRRGGRREPGARRRTSKRPPCARHLEDLDWLESVARAHHRVIEALAARTTVLPLRLATVYLDDERVRQMLDARQEAFAERLADLAAHAEWGVKIYVEAPAADRRARPRHPPSGPQPRAGLPAPPQSAAARP